MIHYHGLRILPDTSAVAAITAGHAFVSFRYTQQLSMAIELCQSFAIDNGAFSAWKAGEPIEDWSAFYDFAAQCKKFPTCDFAIVPDVIDGNEADNDALLAEWPLPRWFGVPVWHLHESLERLERLASSWPRIALGSSGEYSTPGTNAWWQRIGQAMRVLCDDDGRPLCRIHGLRMLNPEIFTRIPFSSADSTNIAANVNIDSNWRNGVYLPPSRAARAQIMRERIESQNAPDRWGFIVPEQQGLFA